MDAKRERIYTKGTSHEDRDVRPVPHRVKNHVGFNTMSEVENMSADLGQDIMKEANEFVIYAYPFRSRAERVLWTLREFDFPYKVIRLDPSKGETRTEEFKALNPSRKIPVLCHGNDVFTESLAIMEYLNEISEHQKLIPTRSKELYVYRNHVHYGLTEIEPYLWLAEQANRLKDLYNWPNGTYEKAIYQVKANISRLWQWTEGGEYTVNRKFSLADIYFYHLITWAKQHGIEHPSGVSTYLDLLQKRPSFPTEML